MNWPDVHRMKFKDVAEREAFDYKIVKFYITSGWPIPRNPYRTDEEQAAWLKEMYDEPS